MTRKKYLTLFNSLNDYTEYSESNEYIKPNVSYVKGNNITKFNYIRPITAGDVAYWDGNEIKTVAFNNWNTTLGTPIGVVVISEGVLPDRKARIMSYKNIDSNGNLTDTSKPQRWGGSGVETGAVKYTKVPITTNEDEFCTSSYTVGYLPSNNFYYKQSFVDENAMYSYEATSNLIPSPYKNGEFNTEYAKELEGNNAMSDFDGFGNTQRLVNLSKDFNVANACWNYDDGVSNLQWYLPSIGELGFLIARSFTFSENCRIIGGANLVLSSGSSYWSSTEYTTSFAYAVEGYTGRVGYFMKSQTTHFRPFALLDPLVK